MLRTIIILIVVSLTMLSCNSGESLQKYFVEKSSDSDFVSVDIAPSVLNVDMSKLSESEVKSYNRFKRINILALINTDSLNSKYDSEKLQIKSILKQEKYQELMKFGSGKNGFSVSYVGEDDKIDEIILFGNALESGFVVVRVLGNNMTSNDIMNLMSVIKNSDVKMEELDRLKNLIK